jgi:hypothetical protein
MAGHDDMSGELQLPLGSDLILDQRDPVADVGELWQAVQLRWLPVILVGSLEVEEVVVHGDKSVS